MTEGARIGYQIRKLRLMSGQTQENVANSLEISQSYLRRIEQGRANPQCEYGGKDYCLPGGRNCGKAPGD